MSPKTPLLLSLFKKRKEEEKRNPKGIFSYLGFVKIMGETGCRIMYNAAKSI
jgi:hypothetical protein